MRIIPLPRPPWPHSTPGVRFLKREQPRPDQDCLTDTTQLTLASSWRPSHHPETFPRGETVLQKH